jgi:hypothetical protein
MIVQLFEKKTENDDPTSPDSIFNMEKEQNRLMAMGVALKCAGRNFGRNFRYRTQCKMSGTTQDLESENHRGVLDPGR